jgi:hypothetical protein
MNDMYALRLRYMYVLTADHDHDTIIMLYDLVDIKIENGTNLL